MNIKNRKRRLYFVIGIVTLIMMFPFFSVPWSQENKDFFNWLGSVYEVIAISITIILLTFLAVRFLKKFNT